MGTQKWYALDHICDALRYVGDKTYLHAGLFNNCHKTFKRAYRLKSKRPKSVMRENIKSENRRATYGHSMQVRPDINCIANYPKENAIETD